ncbi:MAG: type IV toxin-antitoxin system AbiEi family antitoxin [bacterium]|nr:type IV toxin-antitoxin system AbiEi family antitoxin [bacterium]
MSVNNGHGIIADMIHGEYLVQALKKLLKIPGVIEAKQKQVYINYIPSGLEAEIEIKVQPGSKVNVLHAVFKGSVNRAIIDRMLYELSRKELEKLILIVPYVNPSLAEYMNEKEVNFLDLAGNYRLALGKNFYVFTKGRKLATGSPYVSKAKIAGYQVIFAILSEPALLNEPVRSVAEVAGVGKSAVAARITKLAKDGLIGRTTKGWRITRYDDLLDRWIIGYSEIIRPRLFMGSYKSRIEDIEKREAIIEEILKPNSEPWAWGGLSASWRMVDHYRTETSTVHIETTPLLVIMKLDALPTSDTNLVFMRPLGPLSMQGVSEHLVHPLLVYTQLITSDDPRARETANEIVGLLKKGA